MQGISQASTLALPLSETVFGGALIGIRAKPDEGTCRALHDAFELVSQEAAVDSAQAT